MVKKNKRPPQSFWRLQRHLDKIHQYNIEKIDINEYLESVLKKQNN